MLAGDDMAEITHIKSLLNEAFKIKDLGELTYFLGLEVARSTFGIVLYQRKFALELLHAAGYLDCELAKSPLDKNFKLSKDMLVLR